jgi:hypothetical protein
MKQVLSRKVGEGNWHQWKGGGGWERGRRMNMAQCVHMYVNAKMIPVETVQGIREGRMGKRSGKEEFKYDIFDTL